MSQLHDVIKSKVGGKPEEARREVDGWDEKDFLAFMESYIETSAGFALPEPANPGSLSMFPDTWDTLTDTDLIRQMMLYVDRLYIHDPIPRLLGRYESISVVPSFHSREKRFGAVARDLADLIQFMLEIEPLVRAGLVIVLPTYLAELAEQPGALRATDLLSNSGRPMKDPFEGLPFAEQLDTYLTNHSEIAPIDLRTGKPIPLSPETREYPCAVIIRIKGDPEFHTSVHLEFDRSSADDTTHTITAVWHPDMTLTQQQFRNWVTAETRKLAMKRVFTLRRDILLARFVGAAFMTSFPATGDLMPMVTGHSPTPDNRLSTLLELDLPFFDNASMANLAKARANEPAFERFRRQLASALTELSTIQDPGERHARADEILRDLVVAPMKEIQSVNDRLRTALMADSGIAIGSLTAVLLAATGQSPAAVLSGLAVIAGIEALKGIKERLNRKALLEETPGFFYWRAIGGPKSSG